MTDITMDYYLKEIHNFPNKKHWLCRDFVKRVNLEISSYRLVAFKNRGTVLAQYCWRMSNYLEKRLKYSIGVGIN